MKNLVIKTIVVLFFLSAFAFGQDSTPAISPSPTPTITPAANTITRRQLAELPSLNRNFLPFIELAPGVSSDLPDEPGFGLSNFTNISINGLRRNAVNYFVDGVSITEPSSNISLIFAPSLESIEEMKILSSGSPAEIGRSGGGSVFITTRAGGNKFRGSLFEFVRNDKFNSNSFFNNRVGLPISKLRYNNFGGTLSGPAIKNKTFFFASLEARAISRGVTDSGAVVPSILERQGNFSANLGLPLYRTAAGVITTNPTGNTPITVIDTAGNTVQARQNQIFRPSDNRTYAGNIILPSDIDPRSLALLAAYPLPNLGSNGLVFSAENNLNTRQGTFRVDHKFNSENSLFGRFTIDRNTTLEEGGLFRNISLPGVATTKTNFTGKAFAASYTSSFLDSFSNEVFFSFSNGEINSRLVGRGTRSGLGIGSIAERFPENNADAIPDINTRFTTLGAAQGYSSEYANLTFRDNFIYSRGDHLFKFGGELVREIKNENQLNNTQGSFGFSAIQSQGVIGSAAITGTGDSFASFLLGRANTYQESETDFRSNLRFGRIEFFAQDSWRVRPNLTIDLGLRYQYFAVPNDKNNRLASFDSKLYSRSAVVCANPSCSVFTLATDPNNGINFGSIIKADKNNFSPRVGVAYGLGNKTIIRANYGLYYEQPQVGIFIQAAQTVPAFNQNVNFTSSAANVITFSNPAAGVAPSTLGNRILTAIDSDFKTPQIQIYSVGIERELFRNAGFSVSYVGTRGGNLIRRRNINVPAPADVVRVGAANINTVRPFLGYSTITNYETTAKSRYNALQSAFTYRSDNLSLSVAYTFSRSMTDSTTDRDAIDEPQNPFDTRAEFAEARNSRPHVLSVSYIYELPFFRNSNNRAAKLLLAGFQVSGITQIESGAPVPRVTVADTLGGQIGLYPNIVINPGGGLAGTVDPVSGLPFIFDPAAFSPAALGTFGNAGRSFARLPGRNQTNLALSKNFYFGEARFVQLRVESFNVFNHTQFTGINTVLPPIGGVGNSLFGRPTSTRLPREFQFGAKFYF